MQSIGPKIRKLREWQDLTQDYMGAKLGVSQTAYSKIERGESDVAFSTLKKIADVLGVDVVAMLSFEGGMVVHKVSENQQGGQANGFVVNQGLAEKERELYERKIQYLQEEIAFLRALVKAP